MIVRLDKEQPYIGRTDNSVEDERYQVWWDGLIFMKGICSGAPSVRNFLHELHSKELAHACCSLSGTFTCLVFDKLSGNYYAFVDNRNGANLFYSENVIDTSFLDILNYVHTTLRQLRMRTIVEFILTGCVFCPNVFFDSIRSLQRNEILVLKPGQQQVIEKCLPSLFSEQGYQQSFMQVFEDIVRSVKNRQLSIDLTGGMDSRLTVLLFREFGATFETAVSGIANHPDVTISSQLAANLGLNHYVTLHTVDEPLLWQELQETFQFYNGFRSVLEMHRLYQMQRDRARRGCNLAIGSSGGRYANYMKATKKSHLDKVVANTINKRVDNKFIAALLVGVSKLGSAVLMPLFCRRGSIDQAIKLEKVTSIDTVAEELDKFWERNRGKFGITVDRNSRYLKWRIFDNPNLSYEFFLAVRRGDMVGHVITKSSGEAGAKLGTIVDIIADNNNEVIFNSILDRVEGAFRENGICVMRFPTLLSDNFLNQALKRNGFVSFTILQKIMRRAIVKKRQEPLFTAKVLDDKLDPAKVSAPACWYFTDIFMEGRE